MTVGATGIWQQLQQCATLEKHSCLQLYGAGERERLSDPRFVSLRRVKSPSCANTLFLATRRRELIRRAISKRVTVRQRCQLASGSVWQFETQDAVSDHEEELMAQQVDSALTTGFTRTIAGE